jgi:uncharacterized membrane-anchored protein YjiN (DUF445 family)
MTTFQTVKKIDEAKNKAALKKMRRLATMLLLGMAVFFLLAFWLERFHPVLGFLKAFSEAAMIGALADWFAVVALFRHPLNLPIPHTAIIKQHKDRFGENLAVFIKNNFLSRETLEEKLKKIDMALWIGETLTNRGKVEKLVQRAIENFQALQSFFDEQKVTLKSLDFWADYLKRIRWNLLMKDLLTDMIHGNLHQRLLDEALVMVEKVLVEKILILKAELSRGHPWYIPGPIYESFFEKMMARVKTRVSELRTNPSDPLRKKFDAFTFDFANRFDQSEVMIQKLNTRVQEIINSPAFREFLKSLVGEFRIQGLSYLLDPDSEVRKHLAEGVVLFGKSLQEKSEMREKVNRKLYAFLVDFAENYADAIISIISDTVKDWDAVRTSETIELYVGKDLQWIRINGTIVGGLFGLIIYVFTFLFS